MNRYAVEQRTQSVFCDNGRPKASDTDVLQISASGRRVRIKLRVRLIRHERKTWQAGPVYGHPGQRIASWAAPRVREEEGASEDYVFETHSCFCCTVLLGLAVSGCQKKPATPAAGMQAMPVKTETVALSPVAQSSEYVATIMSRRSATLLPQVSGLLTQIHGQSGDHVKAGQALMEIDAQQQMATVQAQRATEQQKKAVFDYDTIELERQRKLFEAGVTSRDAYDQAQQAYDNSKADYESAVSLRKTQEEQLAYYTIRAPYDGVVGDIPVHVGDYVSPLLLRTISDHSG